MNNECCQKHGELFINKSALTDICYYPLSIDITENTLPNTEIIKC